MSNLFEDPYNLARGELERNIEKVTKLYEQYKGKVTFVKNYSKKKYLADLYDVIVYELYEIEKTISILESTIKTVRAHPEKFREISEDEIERRIQNIEDYKQIIGEYKLDMKNLQKSAIENEIYAQNKMNMELLFENKPKNLDSEFQFEQVDPNLEHLEIISKNTKKLYNAANIISQELYEQNHLIQDLDNDLDTESKCKMPLQTLNRYKVIIILQNNVLICQYITTCLHI
ncbi:uncharacterized protein CMU_031480 [Cryptosporidium muris RN66]|uniref:Syntaxin 6/10/61 N-terminal domain-containing protein n=1 Tax=Cryptosporidium muris (strain RN66) TaxID=441375 RepID=B6AIG6_CRYMR|nr:uncharacterized protein CMU_031480 [Cryptosporidium muris RN66]EEA08007.1 hypothetical protein CMU_031480 [Cryptosporidium muris RN66]|eukprot:XP_002142356.1 hypothetical protein [Cryptosporidium muris RN66]